MTSRGDLANTLDMLYVIGTYPILTTTFIDREIASMRKDGAAVGVVSLRRPTGKLSHDQRAMADVTHYLLPVRTHDVLRAHAAIIARHPLRYVALVVGLVRRPHPTLRARARTLLHITEGVCVAHVVHTRLRTQRLHAHFLDRAALVALVVGRLLDIPYSVTGHASDIFVDPVLLAEKINAATSVTTCTEYNARHLASLADARDHVKIRCIHHGIDAERYRPGTERKGRPPIVLSVGQLREKKGHIHLLQACRQLMDRGQDFTCEIVGDGPLRHHLESLASDLGLEGTVVFRGALPWDEVRARYRTASVFALASVTARDGDRDGIPNVILEAMAMELPVVSTDHSGIPEAVLHGHTGLLVPPGDSVALADAIGALLADPDWARALGRGGRHRVVEAFDVESNVRRLREVMA